MYAYGSDTDVSDQEDLIQGSPQLLSEADQDQGDDVHFESQQAVFTGLKGCSGDRKNFGCFILYRGDIKKISLCMGFQPSCPVLGNKSKSWAPPITETIETEWFS